MDGTNSLLSASKSLPLNNLYLCFVCISAIPGNLGEFGATTCSRELTSVPSDLK
jgi:hypothetical protein